MALDVIKVCSAYGACWPAVLPLASLDIGGGLFRDYGLCFSSVKEHYEGMHTAPKTR